MTQRFDSVHGCETPFIRVAHELKKCRLSSGPLLGLNRIVLIWQTTIIEYGHSIGESASDPTEIEHYAAVMQCTFCPIVLRILRGEFVGGGEYRSPEITGKRTALKVQMFGRDSRVVLYLACCHSCDSEAIKVMR